MPVPWASSGSVPPGDVRSAWLWTNVGTSLEGCFKHRNKIGLDVALEALKDARSQKKASADDLWRYAKICRVANVMRQFRDRLARIE